MDRKKVSKLKNKLKQLRDKIGNVSSRELESLAKSLGRERQDRGKHPPWVSKKLPDSVPISIPTHPGALPKYTAGNILDQLERDIFMLEEELNGEGD